MYKLFFFKLFMVLVIIEWSCKPPSKEDKVLMSQAQSLFAPLPDKMPNSENDTMKKISLGKALYMDTRLSVNGQQSCNSCHGLNTAGVDNLPTSPGALGKKGNRNSPSILNAGLHIAQFWDGRVSTLKEQAKKPILNPIEMGMPSADAVMNKIRSVKNYQVLFHKVYAEDKEPFTYDNLADAIAAFERTLITKDRFDLYLRGDYDALVEKEKKGLDIFVKRGCIACHAGKLLGGSTFQKMGLENAYPNQRDKGRYTVTNKKSDKMLFKVPSLRNIANTAPYFHDGSVKTLKEAVRQMAWLQLGKKITEQDVNSIVAFLNSLSDTRFRKD